MVGPALRAFRAVRAGLARASRWLAPSVVAACAGAVGGGVVEGLGMGGALGSAATAGFIGLLAVPALLIASVLARAVIAAWRPSELAARLVEDDGGAPRLAGWLGAIVLGGGTLALATGGGTWLLAAWTKFEPRTIAFGEAMVVVATSLVILALSRPSARAFTAIIRALDARWRRGGRATLLRPWPILRFAMIVGVGVLYAIWRLAVRPRLGPIDTTILIAPVTGLAVVIGVHAVWSRVSRRGVLGSLAVGSSLAMVAIAVVARVAQPALSLEIWGERPLAGLAIDTFFDVDEIRAGVALSEFRPVEQPGAAHPDIILVTIDTMRADHTPPYGGTAAMPILAALGERGSVFTWAYSPSNVTRRSIPSMVIGLAPNRVRGRVVGWALRVDPRHVLLAERLRAGGYETAGFMCCKGFWGPEARTGLQRGLEHLEIEADGPKLAKRASDWITRRETAPHKRPLFLWMHVLEPHNWVAKYGEPHSEAERQASYDKSLAASDKVLAELVRPFWTRAVDAAPIVIVTADHGEALGEHGHPYHSTDLYNSQIRVPLVMAGPGIKALRIAETVSLTDLVPTILELAGFKPPSLDGRSLASLATGQRPSAPGEGTAFAAMIKDRSNPGGVAVLVKGSWKLIDDGGVLELYDIASDPNEKFNLARTKPQIVKELRTLLEARTAAASSPFD